MNHIATHLLRVALIPLLLGAVVAQFLVPAIASQVGTTFPEVAYLVVPYSVAGILVIACGEVALLAVWRLSSLVDDGVIFSRGALRWVDVITACGAVATVLSAVVLGHMLAFVPGGGGPMVYYLTACVAVGSVFVFLMIVLRGLLVAAIADRAELDEVI